MTRDLLVDVDPALADEVAAYRGGYLPEERRELERRLRDGSIRALATTNALEMGIDVSGLDVVITAGWPGTRASLWQQFGRAGRAGSPALGIFVANDDPLDSYLVHHPEVIIDRDVEASVFDPGNRYVLAPHLCAAAAEVPLTADDLATWFGPTARAAGRRARRAGAPAQAAGRLVLDPARAGQRPHRPARLGRGSRARRRGRHRPAARHRRPSDRSGRRAPGRGLRASGGHPRGHRARPRRRRRDGRRAGGRLRHARSHDQRHPHRRRGGGTDLRRASAVSRAPSTSARRWSPSSAGDPNGESLGEEPLDLPVQELRTRAVWWTLPEAALVTAGIPPADIPGAAHAAEHAAIGLLPLFATCDRWDLGGVSTACHADTGQPTVFVYDGYPGGAGFAEHGYRTAAQWLTATRDAIAGLRLRLRLPVLRAVAQVRQRQQPARQGARRHPARPRARATCPDRYRAGVGHHATRRRLRRAGPCRGRDTSIGS